MRRIILFKVLLILSSITFAQQNNPEITADEIKTHITYFAQDILEGRLTGSEGEYEAGDYIRDEFKSYGLAPLFAGSYFQSFNFTEGIKLPQRNYLEIDINGDKRKLKLAEEYITAPFSGNKTVDAGLVFVGYGKSAPHMKYDDYEGIDVKGKVVIAMNNQSTADVLSSYRSKASNARDKGAVGIIFVNGHYPEENDVLMGVVYDGAAGMQDFAAMQVKQEFVDKLFEAEGLNFAEYQKQMNDTKKPNSFEFHNAKIKAESIVEYTEKTGRNVGAWIEGNDPKLKNEYIVIGAHYDHLGWGEKNSRYGGKDKQVHNGADDNASGTTGVLELAEKFASIKDQLKRSIIFVTFTGEELGVLGSSYFVNNPPIPLQNIAAMLNMDMIGRLDKDNSLTIIGAGTSSVWKDIIKEKNTYGFNLALNDDGFGGSDHLPFTQKEIPVLFFFTGIHEDYHMPSDDVEKINALGEENVIKLVFDIADAVDKLETRPGYVKVERKEMPKQTRSKIKTGTIPEFSYQGTGYKISGTTDGSPAQKAGLQGGDIIVKFAGKQVDNIYDFMAAMGDISEGDTIEVVVLRDDKEITLMMELK